MVIHLARFMPTSQGFWNYLTGGMLPEAGAVKPIRSISREMSETSNPSAILLVFEQGFTLMRILNDVLFRELNLQGIENTGKRCFGNKQ